jgi:hypothetical protein
MIINLLTTWIPALGIAFLGVLKLTGNPRVAEEMSKLGVGRYLRLLGVKLHSRRCESPAKRGCVSHVRDAHPPMTPMGPMSPMPGRCSEACTLLEG